MEPTQFEKDLAEVMKKHKKVIFAAPTYTLGEDKQWHLSAEIKWADTKDEPKTEDK